jgi:hypothetical protein
MAPVAIMVMVTASDMLKVRTGQNALTVTGQAPSFHCADTTLRQLYLTLVCVELSSLHLDRFFA